MAMRIVMTGVNGAFGALAAPKLLRQGHHLVATMRDPDGRNQESAAALRVSGATVIDIDVTKDESVSSGTRAAIRALGGIDVLINVAGVGTHGLSEGFTATQLLRLFDINVVGVHRMMRSVLPEMRQQRSGLIINVSSLLGRLSLPFYGPYSATKFALETLSDTFRVELSQFGVDVSLVEPGGFKTTWLDNLVFPDDAARLQGYDEFANVPGQTLAAMNSMLENKPEQDAERVAEAILALVETPAGQRPARTVVDFIGMAGPVIGMNDLLADTTAAVYRAIGSESLLKIKV